MELIDETAVARSIVLEPPAWPGHRAGQHVDVRLTAEDGYQAERSYSIASASEDEPGFWERYDYHMYGDPWQKQRYWGD